MTEPRNVWAAAGRLCTVLATLGIAAAPVFAEPDPRTAEILASHDIDITRGAAAGYVPDETCAQCHADKAESFSEIGMAKSFYRPSPDKVIEDFSALPYHHAESDRYYTMELRDGAYWFSRYTRAPDGGKTDVFEERVDWILGSGNHSRIYLYQTPDGALFQIPLAWYSQEGVWAMSPGFEFKQHPGVQRTIDRRCMACHNAYPEVPEEAGRMGMPAVYPAELPEGIGCQRCHGPGAAHVAAALTARDGIEPVRDAIVHPGKLPREELHSICYGCHMQPNVTVSSQLRLGRGHYSFRPGEKVQDFIAHVDIADADRAQHERFEINHHPYRMEQSACFTQSDGQLGCLTCHDPHVKIRPDERAEHYRDACLSCHTLDDEGLPLMQAAGARHPEIADSADCTTCHMPKRRTQDVVEVTMTDHMIQRAPPPAADRLAPLDSKPVDVAGVHLADIAADVVPEREALILTLKAILRFTQGRADYASDDLARVLRQTGSRDYEPWLTLLQAYIQQREYGKARQVAEPALSLAPGNPQVVTGAAVALFATGTRDKAIGMLTDLLGQRPRDVYPRVTLARLLAAQGRLDEASAHLDRVVALRPNHLQAWNLIAALAQRRGEHTRAIEAYLTALEIEPAAHRIRQRTVRALRGAGRDAEAAAHAARLPR
ncbi:tetratricopeptide repeat protein [Roseovarius salinarum]|uniref:tetratricopeptide repeat protein n=1 Tax=Roseovarius salinarum TaxID=1981892 RepID=UPI000C3371C6|nr:tetratricopeptide repeat protein [Roseovarius salinarum]